MNISCPICFLSFVDIGTIYSIPCGHVFHIACLEQWFCVEHTCPKCRIAVTEQPTKLYLDVHHQEEGVSMAELINKVDGLQAEVILQKVNNKQKDVEIGGLKEQLQNKNGDEQKIYDMTKENQYLTKENQQLTKQIMKISLKETKNDEMKEKTKATVTALRLQVQNLKKVLATNKRKQGVLLRRIQAFYGRLNVSVTEMQAINTMAVDILKSYPVASGST